MWFYKFILSLTFNIREWVSSWYSEKEKEEMLLELIFGKEKKGKND